MRAILLASTIFLGGGALPVSAQAQSAAEICNAAGVCAPVDPVTALVLIGVQVLASELNKGDDAFGPNGVVLAAVNTVLADLQKGQLGPDNDIVKALQTIGNDLQNGLGETNDIVRALASLGVKL